MDFRDLSYVLAIAKYQNITKAAESLYVTQPTLSKFLSGLEDNLGLKLFRRVGNKYVLTFAGERYVEKAQQIMNLKSDLDMELADMTKRDVGVLNVAFPHMRGTYMLPTTLPAFQKMHPNVKVNIFEDSSAANDQRILEGEVEIAFGSKPAELNSLISYETIGTEELLICTKADHRLKKYAKQNPYSRYPRLDPALLKDELVLKMRPEQRTRAIVDDYQRKNNLKFDHVMYTGNMPAIMELVATGYGVSFVFETHLKHRAQKTPIDCYSFGETRTTSDFVVAYRSGAYLSAYARDFIQIAKDLFSEQ